MHVYTYSIAPTTLTQSHRIYSVLAHHDVKPRKLRVIIYTLQRVLYLAESSAGLRYREHVTLFKTERIQNCRDISR